MKNKDHNVEVNPRILGSLISHMNGWMEDRLVRYAYPKLTSNMVNKQKKIGLYTLYGTSRLYIQTSVPNKNFAAYNIITLTEKAIKINPIENSTLSIINETRFPNLPIIGPTKNIGKYWPIILNDAEKINTLHINVSSNCTLIFLMFS